MGLMRHTIIASLIIASFVSLQTVMFFSNFYPSGVIKTEQQAIVAGRNGCAAHQHPLPDGPWRAQLQNGVWVAYTQLRPWPFMDFDGYGMVKLNARTGEVVDCRSGAD